MSDFLPLPLALCLGVVAWLVFIRVGLANASAWACIGGVLHLIPYAGPAAFVAIIALMTYVQFDSLQPVLVTAAVLVATMSIIALFIVPWLTHKTASVNAVTTFVALLVWGWLWGIWGLLLGVPIVMAIKSVCDHVEGLQPVAAFLGNAPLADWTNSQTNWVRFATTTYTGKLWNV